MFEVTRYMPQTKALKKIKAFEIKSNYYFFCERYKNDHKQIKSGGIKWIKFC